VATAKRDLKPGELLDGEGGTVWGKLLPAPVGGHGRPAAGPGARREGAAPGRQGQCLTWADVAMDTSTRAWQIRQQMETTLPPAA
jgi:predicted homoserine dehydrogenase-like protein